MRKKRGGTPFSSLARRSPASASSVQSSDNGKDKDSCSSNNISSSRSDEKPRSGDGAVTSEETMIMTFA